jgi:signal transduction histidine kinase
MGRGENVNRPGRLTRWWLGRSIQTKGTIVLVLPASMLLATTVAFAATRTQAQRSNASVSHTITVQNRLNQALDLIVDAETGVRGYLLTGTVGFLTPFDIASRDLPRLIPEIRTLLSDNPAQTRRLDAFDAAVTRRLDTLDASRQIPRSQVATPQVQQLVIEGKANMDRLRHIQTDMLQAEHDLLNQRQATVRTVLRASGWLVLAALILGVGGGLLSVALFTIGISRRIRHITGNADRLAAGERLAPQPYRAQDEIGRLDLAMNHAANLLNERTAALQRSNHDLEAFNYSAAHDLRTPLRAIGGFSERLLLHHGNQLDEHGRHHAHRIHQAALTMGELIEDLLDLSSIARADLRLQRVDMSAIATGIAAELTANEPHRAVVFDIEDGVTAHADPVLLRTALDNLIGNAWKFTAGRPTAHIRFGTEHAAPGEVACLVGDDGAGFNPAYAQKLFEPFQRLHDASEYPGTGIGLASVLRTIERHGGHVWAEGKLDHGATIHFTIAGQEKS